MSALMGFPRFLAFSVGRALQGIRRNALMSLAAIATIAVMSAWMGGEVMNFVEQSMLAIPSVR